MYRRIIRPAIARRYGVAIVKGVIRGLERTSLDSTPPPPSPPVILFGATKTEEFRQTVSTQQPPTFLPVSSSRVLVLISSSRVISDSAYAV